MRIIRFRYHKTASPSAQAVPRKCAPRPGATLGFRNAMNRRLLIFMLTVFVAPCGHATAQAPTFMTPEARASDFADFCRFVAQSYAYFDTKQTERPRNIQISFSAQPKGGDRQQNRHQKVDA